MYSDRDTLAGGLPHSEIPGSTIARISPGLIAACHALHRLSVPRHPPDALTLLDYALQNPPLTGTSPTSDGTMKTLFTSKTGTTRNPANIPVPRRNPSRSHSLSPLSKNKPTARRLAAICIFHDRAGLDDPSEPRSLFLLRAAFTLTRVSVVAAHH